MILTDPHHHLGSGIMPGHRPHAEGVSVSAQDSPENATTAARPDSTVAGRDPGSRSKAHPPTPRCSPRPSASAGVGRLAAYATVQLPHVVLLISLCHGEQFCLPTGITWSFDFNYGAELIR